MMNKGNVIINLKKQSLLIFSNLKDKRKDMILVIMLGDLIYEGEIKITYNKKVRC